MFENRAARTGRKIPLRVMVVPANVPPNRGDKAPDAITFFAGGPGESAVESAGWLTGRAAALTMEQAGQPVGGEMQRVP